MSVALFEEEGSEICGRGACEGWGGACAKKTDGCKKQSNDD